MWKEPSKNQELHKGSQRDSISYSISWKAIQLYWFQEENDQVGVNLKNRFGNKDGNNKSINGKSVIGKGIVSMIMVVVKVLLVSYIKTSSKSITTNYSKNNFRWLWIEIKHLYNKFNIIQYSGCIWLVSLRLITIRHKCIFKG